MTGVGGDSSGVQDGGIDCPLAPNPRVLCSEVLDEAVLLDLDGGSYFGINQVGARIWQLIAERCTLRELTGRIEAELDAEPHVLERDVAHFVAALRAAGLVVAGTPAGGIR